MIPYCVEKLHAWRVRRDAGKQQPVLVSRKAARNEQAHLEARIRELEALCTDVLVAGVDLGLPQPLLNQLWAAVGHGEMPLAYHVDLPPGAPQRPPTSNGC